MRVSNINNTEFRLLGVKSIRGKNSFILYRMTLFSSPIYLSSPPLRVVLWGDSIVTGSRSRTNVIGTDSFTNPRAHTLLIK